MFLLRSCFPNTLVCFAALSSFGGVGGVILKAALVGVLGGIVVEFFLVQHQPSFALLLHVSRHVLLPTKLI